MTPGRAGRQPTERGDRRREAIVEAATDVLARDGFAAVTHRRVAREAGVPLASTTYYFASGEELAVEALARLGERWTAGSRAVAAAPPDRDRLAERLVHVVAGGAERAALITFYERYVAAARVPAYAAAVTAWTDAVTAIVAGVLAAHGLDPGPAARVVALVDGLLIAALGRGEPDPAAGLAAEVDAVLPGCRG